MGAMVKIPRFAFRAQSLAGNLHRVRLRERYLEAQLPDYVALKRRAAPVEEIVELANGLFEDGEPRTAAEVLTVAIHDQPQAARLWLALAELLYLSRDTANLTAAVEAFLVQFPNAPELGMLTRLGARAAPRSAPFLGVSAGHDETIPGWLRPAGSTDEDAATELHALLTVPVSVPVPTPTSQP